MDENKRKGYRRGRMLLYSCLAVMSLGAMPESSFASSAAPSVYELQQQQSRKVKGTVIDETGQPLIGVSIRVQGSDTGVVTNVDGAFEISVKTNDRLEFTYIGMKSQTIKVGAQKFINVTMHEDSEVLDEVTVVAYGTQKKETLTGAISSVKTEALLRSPNSSVANTLAGQIPGLSSVATSGQPGREDPSIFIRGVGSLSEAASTPLILVDGVERSFFQMDPNEIESVTVLKDASATAVFGVRGANGVVLVTTHRGEEGKAKISLTSSVGIQQPTRILEMADSYTYATLFNEMNDNDQMSKHTFDDYTVERFRLGDEPIMYPNTNWREYLMKNTSVQTQHNVNISGGTKNVRYFISAGFLFQDGLMKQFKELDYNNNYNYTRYNYRSNLDVDLTPSTLLKVGLGGIVGVTHSPNATNNVYDLFHILDMSQPFVSPGIVDGRLVRTDRSKYPGIIMDDTSSGLQRYYGRGYNQSTQNTMNMDLALSQKLDFITKGLSVEVKGAYNTSFTRLVSRTGNVEALVPYYKSSVDNPSMSMDDPSFDKTIVYKIDPGTTNQRLQYGEDNSQRARDWYFEASIRYNRNFNGHNVGALFLYNQNKKYYPGSWTSVPTAYVGFVGRITYDYQSKYLAEINFGYNGSENFAPGKRFGAFPAGSVGYVITEEEFMKNQHVIDFLKLRASVGLVGNDNMSGNRFLYLPDAYEVDKSGEYGEWRDKLFGYNFGYNNYNSIMGAIESRIGNPDVTWEKALKRNYGIDVNFLSNRLRISADVFFENRKDILIKRSTIPAFSSLSSSLLPVVNLGKVNNKGYEVELKWNDRIKDFNYWINTNVTYSKNKIIEQDEVEPNEPYMWSTGKPVGTIFGYVFERFYNEDDFTSDGTLKEGYADPGTVVHPGDCKYADLNNDGVIDTDDVKDIGYPTRPAYTFGLNYGFNFKGWSFTMNWAGAAQRSLLLSDNFRKPFNGGSSGLLMFHVDNRWTPETAETATIPRFSSNSLNHNTLTSSLWVKDGSYFKLKTVQLGYTFTKGIILRKLGITQLGVTLSGYNLLTFDKFGIMDPECNPNGSNTYPITKIYNLGLNITF